MELTSLIEQLETIALERGANAVKCISTRDIKVYEWVRLKCEYGCSGYGRPCCPPHIPTPKRMKEILQEYHHALLVEFVELKTKEDQKRVHKVMVELERIAFLNGYYEAFALTAGPCRICESCVGSVESKLACKNPKLARPSMEACGIDVYQTVRNAGLELEVVKSKGEPFKSFGLLLLF